MCDVLVHGAILKLVIISIKIWNAEIVDIPSEKQKAVIQDHWKYNINLFDYLTYLCLEIGILKM